MLKIIVTGLKLLWNKFFSETQCREALNRRWVAPEQARAVGSIL